MSYPGPDPAMSSAGTASWWTPVASSLGDGYSVGEDAQIRPGPGRPGMPPIQRKNPCPKCGSRTIEETFTRYRPGEVPMLVVAWRCLRVTRTKSHKHSCPLLVISETPTPSRGFRWTRKGRVD